MPSSSSLTIEILVNCQYRVDFWSLKFIPARSDAPTEQQPIEPFYSLLLLPLGDIAPRRNCIGRIRIQTPILDSSYLITRQVMRFLFYYQKFWPVLFSSFSLLSTKHMANTLSIKIKLKL